MIKKFKESFSEMWMEMHEEHLRLKLKFIETFIKKEGTNEGIRTTNYVILQSMHSCQIINKKLGTHRIQ